MNVFSSGKVSTSIYFPNKILTLAKNTHTHRHKHTPCSNQTTTLLHSLPSAQACMLRSLGAVVVVVVVDIDGESEVAGRGGRGSIPRLFMKDSSWSGISARTSLASRAMLRTWFPERSM